MIVPPKIDNEREIIIWRERISRLIDKLENEVFPPTPPPTPPPEEPVP